MRDARTGACGCTGARASSFVVDMSRRCVGRAGAAAIAGALMDNSTITAIDLSCACARRRRASGRVRVRRPSARGPSSMWGCVCARATWQLLLARSQRHRSRWRGGGCGCTEGEHECRKRGPERYRRAVVAAAVVQCDTVCVVRARVCEAWRVVVVARAGNSIGPAGAAALAEALKVNTAVTSLGLRGAQASCSAVDSVARWHLVTRHRAQTIPSDQLVQWPSRGRCG